MRKRHSSHEKSREVIFLFFLQYPDRLELDLPFVVPIDSNHFLNRFILVCPSVRPSCIIVLNLQNPNFWDILIKFWWFDKHLSVLGQGQMILKMLWIGPLFQLLSRDPWPCYCYYIESFRDCYSYMFKHDYGQGEKNGKRAIGCSQSQGNVYYIVCPCFVVQLRELRDPWHAFNDVTYLMVSLNNLNVRHYFPCKHRGVLQFMLHCRRVLMPVRLTSNTRCNECENFEWFCRYVNFCSDGHLRTHKLTGGQTDD